MKPSLQPGIDHELRFRVPVTKTVPALYREAPEFQRMPLVFATGFLVGLIEWACIRAVDWHLDAGEQTLGTGIDVTHAAATPSGMAVTVHVRLVRVEGRRLTFEVVARDGIDEISRGTHQRFVIDRQRFDDKVNAKVATLLDAG